jgi:hypothetical protein
MIIILDLWKLVEVLKYLKERGAFNGWGSCIYKLLDNGIKFIIDKK